MDFDEDGNRFNPDIEMPLVLINPEITERSKNMVTGDEGCLSIPGITLPIRRAESISVKFTI